MLPHLLHGYPSQTLASRERRRAGSAACDNRAFRASDPEAPPFRLTQNNLLDFSFYCAESRRGQSECGTVCLFAWVCEKMRGFIEDRELRTLELRKSFENPNLVRNSVILGSPILFLLLLHLRPLWEM